MSNFNRKLKYGQFAEDRIAEFFTNKGYYVEYAEDYAIFPQEEENRGPRISVLDTSQISPSSPIELIEVSCTYLIAPDLRISKDRKIKYVEVKRREKLSLFKGEEIVYIKYYQWNDYVELVHYCKYFGYGSDVLLYVFVDDYYGEEKIFYQQVEYLDENIQYARKNKYVAFNLKNFLMI